jgi:hypothetical protein
VTGIKDPAIDKGKGRLENGRQKLHDQLLRSKNKGIRGRKSSFVLQGEEPECKYKDAKKQRGKEAKKG